MSVGPTISKSERLPLYMTKFNKSCAELIYQLILSRGIIEYADVGHPTYTARLLRTCGERPGRRGAKSCNKLPPSHMHPRASTKYRTGSD
jgi:hypothetical protein